MADSYGDGWNDAYFTLHDANNTEIVSRTLATGSSETATIVLATSGAYTVACSAGSYPGEVSWTFTLFLAAPPTRYPTPASVPTVAPTGSPSPPFDTVSGVAPFNETVYLVAGSYSLVMADSYGDGWNDAYFTLHDVNNTEIVSVTLATGSSGTVSRSIATSGTYTLACSAGSYANEVSWTFTLLAPTSARRMVSAIPNAIPNSGVKKPKSTPMLRASDPKLRSVAAHTFESSKKRNDDTTDAPATAAVDDLVSEDWEYASIGLSVVTVLLLVYIVWGKCARLPKDEQYKKAGAIGKVGRALDPVSQEFSLLVPRRMIKPRV